MAIKMRVLCTPGKKKLVSVTQMIKQEFELNINAADVIPPAYSCDKERLVVLCVTCKGSLKDDIRLFISELNKTRAANVALHSSTACHLPLVSASVSTDSQYS